MSCCRLSHKNSLKEMVQGNNDQLPLAMEIFAISSTLAAIHFIVAKVLKSDVKVAATLGAITGISNHTIAIIDHRYTENDDATHSFMYRLARYVAIIAINCVTIRCFAVKGRCISLPWAVVTPLILIYWKEVDALNVDDEM